MNTPWIPVPELTDDQFRVVRRRAIFECCKWDPQVGDVCTLARAPLVTTSEAWRELSRLAELLARETLSLEAELCGRPELHARLGLPRAARRALTPARDSGATEGVARIVRFDFHHTTDGWRISEANSDVPGGLNEASGLPSLVAPLYPRAVPAGDPAGGYVDALLEGRPCGARVALLHATAYSDDNQMMTFLAQLLAARGARPLLASPAHVTWNRQRAHVGGAAWQGEADVLLRFFPADWLVDLPGTGWTRFYRGGLTPMSNPATALLTQSKRAPLVWDELRTPLPTWRALLPESRDPREVRWQHGDEWVLKPALGRVGEGVAIPGLTSPRDWHRIRVECARRPDGWVAQRPFQVTPLETASGPVFPCVGVYTVNERVVGAYGRLAPRALIDGRAEDAAVLVGREH
jgi:glutathionylspermidine synthase